MKNKVIRWLSACGFLLAVVPHVFAAHTYDTKAQTTMFTSPNPRILSYTCGSGTTLLVVMIQHLQTSRTGGAPTYNSVAMTQVGAEVLNAQEVGVEMWYMIDPPTGAAHDISVPNTGSQNIQVNAASFKAQAGATSALDQNTSTNVDGANPSLNRTTTVDGDVCIDVLGDGYTSPPSARTHTLLYTDDPGAFSYETQYALQGSYGLITMSHTVASDDVAMIMACFKEVLTQKILTAESGSYTHTGISATLKTGRAITAAAGSFSFTGTDASFHKGFQIAADSTSYSLTGSDITFKRTYNFTAESGPYTWTGSSVELHVPMPHIHADEGAYAYSGSAATLNYNRKIQAETGIYSQSGDEVALITQRKLSADSETYAWTGSDATLQGPAAGEILNAESDSYAYLGEDAILKADRKISADLASYEMAGTDATLNKTYVMVAGAGNYSWSGRPANLGDTEEQDTLMGGGLMDGVTLP